MFSQRDHRHRYHSDECRREAERRRARERAQAVDARDRLPRPCRNCGESFSPAYGEKNRLFCSIECRETKLDRIERAARRAKVAGVKCESGLDPFDIFERDGWRCYICGDPTPKELRGSRHRKAPELDHVIPIAEGGPHTRENTACCCKACNWKKGTGEVDQAGYRMPDWRAEAA